MTEFEVFISYILESVYSIERDRDGLVEFYEDAEIHINKVNKKIKVFDKKLLEVNKGLNRVKKKEKIRNLRRQKRAIIKERVVFKRERASIRRYLDGLKREIKKAKRNIKRLEKFVEEIKQIKLVVMKDKIGGMEAMPMYEFECPKCGEKMEEIFSKKEVAEEAELLCPNCGETLTWENKLFSGAARTPLKWK